MLSIEAIAHILAQAGTASYGGEAVSQLEHALQCAALAEAADQSKEMITACLLHDLGHLVRDLTENSIEGIDYRHEVRAMPLLRQLFSQGVTEPIRLHVQAKRYLCFADQNYWAALSDVSKQSLELQGGIFSEAAAAKFIAQSYAKDAVQLRIWDDQAKVINLPTPDLKHFTQIMAACTTFNQ